MRKRTNSWICTMHFRRRKKKRTVGLCILAGDGMQARIYMSYKWVGEVRYVEPYRGAVVIARFEEGQTLEAVKYCELYNAF